MWITMPQQQQRGVQFRPGRKPGPGEAPAEAVKDRAAQDHEQAGEAGEVPDGNYPASRLEDRPGDNTPGAPEPVHPDWDALVQPERNKTKDRDALPLPEGK
jgi:hypothetical protein